MPDFLFTRNIVRSACVLATIVLSPVAMPAQARDVAIPVTAPGRHLTAVLSAYNSDVQGLSRTIAQHFDTTGAGVGSAAALALAWQAERGRSGRYSVRRIVGNTRDQLTILAEATTELWAEITVRTDSLAPYAGRQLTLRPVPRPDSTPGTAPVRSLRAAMQELREFTARLASANLFSGVVLVTSDTGRLLAAAFGTANRASRTPITVDTRFNLASIGKSFTSVAVAQLMEQGLLSPATKAVEVLPDIADPALRQQVSIHQLLTHRSGMGDFFRGPRFATERMSLRNTRDYERLFDRDTLEFAPGSRVQYSNNAFVLLGAMIERLSGATLQDYLRQHVFAPAHMMSTSYLALDSVVLMKAAVGYTLRDAAGDPGVDGRRANTAFLPYRGGPAGGAYSTAPDLERFARALIGGTLLGPQLFDLITTAKADLPAGPGLLAREGYGFFDERVRGHRVISNNGGQAGVNTQLDIYPDARIVVVVLSNFDGPAALAVAEKARRLLLR